MVISPTERTHALSRGEHLGTEGAVRCRERCQTPALLDHRAPCWGCLWDGLQELTLVFKLLEFCSAVPPNVGEVRHMESREQC